MGQWGNGAMRQWGNGAMRQWDHYNDAVSRPRFFAPDARPGMSAVALPADEAHHLRHVLRLSTGDQVGIFDGQGREWVGRVAGISKDAVDIELTEIVAPVPEPPVSVTLGVALLKGDQMDAVVRDATMLGAAEIALIVSDHVAVSRRAERVDRWRRIAVASAKQCGRAVVPLIHPAATLTVVLNGASQNLRLICLEPRLDVAGQFETTSLTALPRPAAALLLTGPEGGWSAAELATARAAAVTGISLGPRTLRAETAPAIALAGMWTAWGW